MDDKYITVSEDGIKYTGYTENVMAILNDLDYRDLTYFNLPSDFQVDSPLTQWSYFRRDMINGKGMLPAGFRNLYPIELTISK